MKWNPEQDHTRSISTLTVVATLTALAATYAIRGCAVDEQDPVSHHATSKRAVAVDLQSEESDAPQQNKQ